MRRPLRPLLTALAAIGLLAAAAPPSAPAACADGYCRLQMTAPELVMASERLVLAGRFAEARPLLAALAAAPEVAMERQFLEGYVAAETGDYATAVKKFRAVLALRPEMTRARLELARALMIQGKDKAAEYHFRLAQEDKSLPPDVARTIYAARGLIRDRRTWDLTVDVGFAPDTNINNATSDRTVDILLGNATLPLTLDENARKKTGLGQTASVSGSARIRLSDGLAAVVDADGNMVNYDGRAADDLSSLVAAGPELTFKDGTRVTVQATFAQRWFGGDLATRSYGARTTVVADVTEGGRIQALADVRRTESGFGPGYDGTSYLGSVTWEQVVRRSIVASLTGFVRREDLRSDAFANTEFGAVAGIGGELPWGLNAGLSLSASRATYDGALAIFPEARKDWRYAGRAYIGARTFRLAGFSPSLTYSYTNVRSNLELYRFDRHRAEFKLARYF
jgi:tetratricopeptide (TPR) repeat protein